MVPYPLRSPRTHGRQYEMGKGRQRQSSKALIQVCTHHWATSMMKTRQPMASNFQRRSRTYITSSTKRYGCSSRAFNLLLVLLRKGRVCALTPSFSTKMASNSPQSRGGCSPHQQESSCTKPSQRPGRDANWNHSCVR